MRLLRNLGMLAILMIAFGISGFAATVIVPAANTNTASNRKPFGSFFGFERTAAIYTAAEHGMTPGAIVTDVCFFVNSVTTPDDVPITIYMSTTASTTFVASTFASEIAGASPVFTGTITGASLIAGSFRCVTLTTPFNYTGNNLKVMVQADFGGSGNEGSTAKQFRWSAGASQTWQADGAAPAGTGTVSATTRPNVQLIFNPPVGPGTLQFSSATYAGNEGTSALVTVNRVGGQTGAVSVNYATSDGTATGADYTTASGTLNWADMDSAAKTFLVPLTTDGVVDPGETVILTLSVPVGTTITGTNPATLTITDVPPPFNGTYTVGTAGNYPSLTLTGGIFEAINLGGASGPVTINIISDLAGETGAVTLNPIAGNPAVLIKPSGAPRTISGIAPIAVIRINGADNIRLDGSTAATVVGGNPALRELTVQNLSTSTSSGVIAIGSATESSTGDTVKNVNVVGTLSTVVVTDPATLTGISIGGATPGSAAVFANNNSRVENCSVRRVLFGIFSSGVVATPNTGTVITQNDLTGTALDRVKRVGILVFNDNGVQITENSVGGIDNTGESADAIGIGVGTQGILSTGTTSGGVSNAIVNRNKVNGVSQDATFSAAGIAVAGGTLGANIISNNMISGVIADATLGDIVAGIWVAGVAGSTTRLFYNSVSMTGNRSALLTPGTAQYPSYAVAITGTDPTVELKNNIFYTTQTADLVANPAAFSYGIGMQTTAALTVNLDSNYNDFFSTGANDMGFRTASLSTTGGVDFATVALWGAAVTDDVNSVILGEVDPSFVSPLTDLHITGVASPVYDKGIAVSVLDDHDGQIRSVVGFAGGVPDIGADEFVAPVAANASVSGRVSAANGYGIRNAVIEVAGGNLTEPRYVRTSSFGYYQVDDLEVGETYVLTVQSKRFVFANPSIVLTVQENVGEVNFEAIP